MEDIARDLNRKVHEAARAVGAIKMQALLNLPGEVEIVPNLKEVNSSASELEQATREARQELVVMLDSALTVALSSPVWGWSDGSRDILDSGDLRDSQLVAVMGESIVIDYGVPYARFVHEGGYIQPYGNPNAEPVYVPGRPWIDAVLYGNGPVPGVNLDEEIRQAILRRL